MKNVKHTLLGLALTGLIALQGFSQVTTPRPSPNCEVEQEIGLTEVEVKYSRPGIKGRKIYGDLVPFGKLWRTGANSATSIKTKDTLMFAGNKLAPGKYSLFTIPGESEWTIVFNKDANASVPQYKQEKDALRFTVKPEKYGETVETFTIEFSNLTDNSANMRLLWENTLVNIPISAQTDAMVMKSIEKTLVGASSRDYYLSARYYFENGKDIKQATTWINKAVEMDAQDPKFWVVYWQAEILKKSGDKKGAIAAAEKSKELAIKAKYDEYVKKNDAIINSLK